MTGCWLVQTASGTVHILDFVSGNVTRMRAAEDSEPDFEMADLRLDGDPVPLLAIARCQAGQPLVMVLQVRDDDVQTVRQTTPVLCIRRLPKGDPS